MAMLSQMVFPVILGVMLGCAYTNGASLGQSLFKSCTKMLLVLLAVMIYGCSVGWLNVAASCAVGFGCVLVVWLKLRCFRPPLPNCLRGSLAARPGESEPDLFPNARGGWDMFYSNGTTMCYDARGKLVAMQFTKGWTTTESVLEDCSEAAGKSTKS